MDETEPSPLLRTKLAELAQLIREHGHFSRPVWLFIHEHEAIPEFKALGLTLVLLKEAVMITD